MDAVKKWIFWTLLILLVLWSIATYYNGKTAIRMTQNVVIPNEPEEDALTPFFPPVEAIVGDTPRTQVGECVESKPPSTDLPVLDIPMNVVLESSNMRLRTQCKI